MRHCERKKPIKHCICEEDYACNPNICTCERDKDCKITRYLKDCTCMKW